MVRISFEDPHGEPAAPLVRELSAGLTCHNRDLGDDSAANCVAWSTCSDKPIT